MKRDTKIPRIQAFIKRLLQICLYQEPNFICCCLFLISEVIFKNIFYELFIL